MKRFLAVLLAAAVIMALVACGSSDKKETGSETTEASGSKETLIIGHYGDTPNFDTHNNLNDNGMRINMTVYDPLVRMDNTSYEIKPCIAESWSVSEDGKEYTFQIKKGVKFNDGSEMQLSDVVFSLERGMEMPMAVPSFARVVGVEAVGEDSVKVTLDGPYPEFLFAMALPTAGILSEKAVTDLGEEFAKRPVTTGPYMVKEWKTGEKVVLEANPHYHLGEAAIKEVEYRVIADPNSAVISLESGDIDAYISVLPTNFKRIEESETLTLHKGNAFAFRHIAMNTTKAPFDNIKAREAMAYATDKEAVLNGVLDGDGTITDTFAQPGYVGYTDDVEKYSYDLDKAKALFTEAGVVEGDEITISVYDARMSKVAQVLQNSLAEIGITAKIDQMERSAFDDAVMNGDTQLICDGNTFTAPTIDEGIYGLFHSGEILNKSHYSNEKMDKLFDDARVTLDESKRDEIYQEVLVDVSKELPAIPLTWSYNNIATKKGLSGVTANPWNFYNIYDFSWE